MGTFHEVVTPNVCHDLRSRQNLDIEFLLELTPLLRDISTSKLKLDYEGAYIFSILFGSHNGSSDSFLRNVVWIVLRLIEKQELHQRLLVCRHLAPI